MIQLKITGVARKASAHVGTNVYTYPKDSPRVTERYNGAQWEEVEFQIAEEGEPPIGIANIDGSAHLVGGAARILLNDPRLFGTFKVGDIVNFAPTIEATVAEVQEPTKTEPAPPPAANATAEETIVVPKLF